MILHLSQVILNILEIITQRKRKEELNASKIVTDAGIMLDNNGVRLQIQRNKLFYKF